MPLILSFTISIAPLSLFNGLKVAVAHAKPALDAFIRIYRVRLAHIARDCAYRAVARTQRAAPAFFGIDRKRKQRCAHMRRAAFVFNMLKIFLAKGV